ncbi:hypothetical protein [Sulfolobus islandicus rod-shaped virus 2]|uniref:Uncharacterized protein n=1 Tax=Sulfolobus islandicus rod-shaped virus 2 TaxID=157899 RepID=Q8V9R3_SIRV2|nr:hypothetical protein SIRV2gp05 [Sulfolobus islandicus rod-shaped virus 2]CAC87280.1 hypothetical protein [Sulfolobus islandicus rod-shaped virus 2]
MNVENQVEKIVSLVENFFDKSNKPIETIKLNGKVMFNEEQYDDLIGELAMTLARGKLEIYEREIQSLYFSEFICVKNNEIVTIRMFFEKTREKYQLKLIEMTRLIFKCQ